MKAHILALVSMLCASPIALAQKAAAADPFPAETQHATSKPPSYIEREARRLDGYLEQRERHIVIRTDSPLMPDFVQEIVTTSNDVATRFRNGYQITGHGTVYIHGDVMYRPKRNGSFEFGIATVGHHTGPAIRFER